MPSRKADYVRRALLARARATKTKTISAAMAPISMPAALREKTRPAVPDPPRAPLPAPLQVKNGETEGSEPVPSRKMLDANDAERGELQQVSIGSGLRYETSMAAFEAEGASGRRPTKANVGFASIKGGFQRGQ